MRLRLLLPEDPARRNLVVAVLCSILLHLLLLGGLIRAGNAIYPPMFVKRGEALFVDITPDKPEEKAPLGNPARPVGPDTKAPDLPPKEVVPPAKPSIAEAPRPPAPRAPARAPEPPSQTARAAPPAPESPAAKAPESAPAAPQPRPAEPSKAEPGTRPAQPPPAPETPPPGTAVARTRPETPAGIWRQPGGGGGLHGGRGGVEGEPIPLDTPEPKYQDYFNKIRDQIKSKWIYPREAGERGIQGELLVEFHIAKDGQLQFLELRHTSGEEILDRFAMNAVRLAQPFPPVPENLAKQALAVTVLFRYQIVGTSLLNQYLR